MLEWKTNTVVFCDPPDGKIYEEKADKFFSGLSDLITEQKFYLSSFPSIWIKDYFPIQLDDGSFAKFSFCYDYLSEEERETYYNFFMSLHNPIPYLKNCISYEGIKLDGGNITRNSRYIICSNKLVHDNGLAVVHDIERIFERELILIDADLRDKTGHIDGMARFLNEETLLVNEQYLSAFNGLKLMDVNIIPVPSPFSNKTIDGWWSCSGNYINFIQTKDQVIVPTYSDVRVKDEVRVSNFFEGLDLDGRELSYYNCDPIAHFGGALNCCTWNAYIEDVYHEFGNEEE